MYIGEWYMIYGYNVFHRPHPVSSSILYVHVSEMLCCARFPAVVHVSQKLCTLHKPSKNVRVQLYTHWARSNQQKHWGDQARSSNIYIYITCNDSCKLYVLLYIYIYMCVYMYIIDWYRL